MLLCSIMGRSILLQGIRSKMVRAASDARKPRFLQSFLGFSRAPPNRCARNIRSRRGAPCWKWGSGKLTFGLSSSAPPSGFEWVWSWEFLAEWESPRTASKMVFRFRPRTRHIIATNGLFEKKAETFSWARSLSQITAKMLRNITKLYHKKEEEEKTKNRTGNRHKEHNTETKKGKRKKIMLC